VAQDTGYRDGLQAGRQDFDRRKDYHPEKHDGVRRCRPRITKAMATRIATRSYTAGDLCAVTRTRLTGNNWTGVGASEGDPSYRLLLLRLPASMYFAHDVAQSCVFALPESSSH
jgi:hypothetical protein